MMGQIQEVYNKRVAAKPEMQAALNAQGLQQAFPPQGLQMAPGQPVMMDPNNALLMQIQQQQQRNALQQAQAQQAQHQAQHQAVAQQQLQRQLLQQQIQQQQQQ